MTYQLNQLQLICLDDIAVKLRLISDIACLLAEFSYDVPVVSITNSLASFRLRCDRDDIDSYRACAGGN